MEKEQIWLEPVKEQLMIDSHNITLPNNSRGVGLILSTGNQHLEIGFTDAQFEIFVGQILNVQADVRRLRERKGIESET